MESIYKKRKTELARLRGPRPLEEDPFPNEHGALCSHHIAALCSVTEQSRLIDDFKPEQLKPAGYKLRIGDEYYLGGKIYYLPSYNDASDADRRTSVKIPPFEVAVIKTAETLCMPRFLIARWNIVVKHAYSGLLWVGGPQVDPGYVGHLYCPIYNLSDVVVELDEFQDIALIDFVKTTSFDQEESVRWEIQEKAILNDYVRHGLRSALMTEAGTKLKTMQSEIDNVERRFTAFTQFMMAALAVIPAVLAALLPFQDSSTLTSSIWGPVAIGFSTFAFSAALLRWFSGGKGANRIGWGNGLFLIGTPLLLFVITFYLTYHFNAAFVEKRAAVGQMGSQISGALDGLLRDVSGLWATTTELQRQYERTNQSLAVEMQGRIAELERKISLIEAARDAEPAAEDAGGDRDPPSDQ